MRHVVFPRAERPRDFSSRQTHARDGILGDGRVVPRATQIAVVETVRGPNPAAAVEHPRVASVRFERHVSHLSEGRGPPGVGAARRGDVDQERLRRVRRGFHSVPLRRVLHVEPRRAGPGAPRARQKRGLLRVYHQVQVTHLVAVAPPGARRRRAIPSVERTRRAKFIPRADRHARLQSLEELRELRVSTHQSRRGCLGVRVRGRVGFGDAEARPRGHALEVHLASERVGVDAERERL